MTTKGHALTSVVGSNTTSFAWDYENRLTSVTLPGSGGTVSFKYDPFGRRIYKSSSGGTSIYAYDVDNLMEEVNSYGTVVARYSQTQNIDESLAMLRGGATSYYHADAIGSVSSLSNAAGTLAQTYSYDPSGKQTASSGSLTNPFQFTGRESDAETGLYFYRARYYDPTTGRFLSEDPLQFLPGENFYRYVDNNPVFWRDASGLSPSSPVAILVPSTIVPGRKLEGNLDPLCQKGRNLALDAAMLGESISTRTREIAFYANHPDPNQRARAGDPGHVRRLANEYDALERCKDKDPNCDPEPEPRFVPFAVPDSWKRQPAPAAGAVGGLVVIVGILMGLAFAL